MTDLNWTAFYLILVNIIAFAAFGIDKRKAVKHKYRISEATLLGLALIGGSAGALAGMHLFHHKTKKLLFRAVPMLLAVQIALLIIF
ncbi:DUF1294 domain-containing protein [Faecalicatena contorta]|uniref:DUF1294 domain-containing protein n=1 Tax=Faecalicatena fissicatena TaxID=290055 RepID=A0ABS2EBK8_9FIRM|nr:MULTISPECIES: DUF1294 domain-containing protein [Clostridia]MBM6686818.1 DUF1294 domain-containing protein [Faecalicatena contorta]MBM6712051.1 DUF1294 domain-containing protein [Faecalicatena contorta]MBM6738940.1 DUF1294 domain-containing protein [Faecalicatena fissicatena]HIX98147.1 DUF1294 domain-containing protein [Candidatus Dorea intestinigallinarum]